MENTVADSNSESDISDSWAVIGDDSSLELNNEISLVGLEPSQYGCVKIPRSNSSTSELSDEDSIEVLAEDHTDNLSDEEADVVQDEECTGTDQLESNENIITRTCRPTPDLPQHTTELKKINHKWRESNPILIAILLMGILGGFYLGYLWASHSYQSEDSTSNSIQPTRALLAKLTNEIQFLRGQLNSSQSSLKSAISKTIPKLNHLTKQGMHTKTKGNHFNVVYPGKCSITDFIVKSPILQDDSSKEYCLASDKPQANENDWTSSANNMSVNIVHTSSSSDTSPVNKYLELNTRLDSDATHEYTAQDANQIGQTFQESSEKPYFEPFPLGIFQHVNAIEAVPSSDIITKKTIGTTAGNEKIMSNSEGRSDPRPYTKLRTIVERIYTILSLIDNENQTVFPSQVELLSILPENIVSLDLSKGHFTTNVYDKITRSTIQMHDATQKLFADIDLSINNFVQHIAFKIKEIETFSRKQICNHKSIVESSGNIALLDLDHEPIFKKCIQGDKENDHNDLIKSEYKNELTGSKDICMVSDSSTSDQKEPSDKISMVKGKNYIHHEAEHRNENVQQSDTQHLNFDFGEAMEGKEREETRGPKKNSDLGKMSPKVKTIIIENKSQLKESTNTPMQPEADTYSDKEIKSNIEKTAKNYKSGAKHVSKKREKSGMKKKLNNKEKDYYKESHGKDKKDINKSSKWVVNTNKTISNMSGEWALKMAHGRAEQRRRDHQSDWVFERAKSRTSNRRKSVKESYWHNDRDHSSKFFNSGVCNKTMPRKDQTSKRWKEVKQSVKKNLWIPFIDSAKSVKKAFNKFNSKLRYHSSQK